MTVTNRGRFGRVATGVMAEVGCCFGVGVCGITGGAVVSIPGGVLVPPVSTAGAVVSVSTAGAVVVSIARVEQEVVRYDSMD